MARFDEEFQLKKVHFLEPWISEDFQGSEKVVFWACLGEMPQKISQMTERVSNTPRKGCQGSPRGPQMGAKRVPKDFE